MNKNRYVPGIVITTILVFSFSVVIITLIDKTTYSKLFDKTTIVSIPDPIVKMGANEDLLTKEDAAKFLKLKTVDELDNLLSIQYSSDKKLNPLAGIGKTHIKSININGNIYFSKKQLIEWVDDHLSDVSN
jgi:hypothetical protein